jgi:hypothetical protein
VCLTVLAIGESCLWHKLSETHACAQEFLDTFLCFRRDNALSTLLHFAFGGHALVMPTDNDIVFSVIALHSGDG